MTKEEREVVISWSEADDKISIATTSGPIMTKCNRLGYEVIRDIKAGNGRIIGREYLCPLKSVSFRSPIRVKKVLTDEQRKGIGERFRSSQQRKAQIYA